MPPKSFTKPIPPRERPSTNVPPPVKEQLQAKFPGARVIDKNEAKQIKEQNEAAFLKSSFKLIMQDKKKLPEYAEPKVKYMDGKDFVSLKIAEKLLAQDEYSFDKWKNDLPIDYDKVPFNQESFVEHFKELRRVFGYMSNNHTVWIRDLKADYRSNSIQKRYAVNEYKTWSEFKQTADVNFWINLKVKEDDPDKLQTVSLLDVILIYCRDNSFCRYSTVSRYGFQTTKGITEKDPNHLYLWHSHQMPRIVESVKDAEAGNPKYATKFRYNYSYKREDDKRYKEVEVDGVKYQELYIKPSDQFMELLEKCYGRGQVERIEYITGHFAYLIQNPCVKSGVAIIFIGDPGAGKNSIINIVFGPIFLDRFGSSTSVADITGKYNASWAYKQVILFNEITDGDGKYVIDMETLKSIITDEQIRIEAKYLNSSDDITTMNLILLSNHKYPIPVPPKDRRFAVFEVSNDYAGNYEFWNKFYDNITRVELCFIYNWFMNKDLSKFNSKDIPMTPERHDMMVNANSVTAFVFNMNWEKFLPNLKLLTLQLMYDLYVKFCEGKDIGAKRYENHFKIKGFTDVLRLIGKEVLRIEKAGEKETVVITKELLGQEGTYMPDLRDVPSALVHEKRSDKFEDEEGNKDETASIHTVSKDSKLVVQDENDPFDTFVDSLLGKLPELFAGDDKPKLVITYKEIFVYYEQFMKDWINSGLKGVSIKYNAFCSRMRVAFSAGANLLYVTNREEDAKDTSKKAQGLKLVGTVSKPNTPKPSNTNSKSNSKVASPVTKPTSPKRNNATSPSRIKARVVPRTPSSSTHTSPSNKTDLSSTYNDGDYIMEFDDNNSVDEEY